METLELQSEQFDEVLNLDLTEHKHSEIAISLDGYRAFWVVIGPELAKKILGTYSTDYRKLRPKHFASITEDMKNDEFIVDGSPIRMSTVGIRSQLSDGQHRMSSIIESGKRIEFLVIDRLPDHAYDTMDTNSLVRVYTDILRRRKVPYVTDVAALTRYLHKWYNPRINSLDTNYRMSVPMLDRVYDEHSTRILWSVQNASVFNPHIAFAPKSLIGLSLFILGQISEASIKGFFESVAHGEMIRRGMPAYTLKTRLQLEERNKRDRDPNEIMYLIFRSWKVYNQNLMRHAGNQLELGNIPLPTEGVTIRDLMELMANGE